MEKSWRWAGGGFRGRGQLEGAGLYGVGRVASVERGRGPDVRWERCGLLTPVQLAVYGSYNLGFVFTFSA